MVVPTNDSSSAIDRAIAQFLEAEDAGSPLSRESFLERYPALRKELTEFLDNHLDLTKLTCSHHGKSDVRSQSRLAPGSRFAGYEILAVAGVGGSSVVYHARQVAPPREVALKILTASPDRTTETLARYRQEVAAIVKLSHPSVAAIYEVGEFNNLLYYSTEWLPGGTLESRFGDYRQHPIKAADVILRVSHAVAHAHARGIIHRDLKPSNILLDSEEQPKLVDFGLASEIDRQVFLTRSGEAVGTPHYMAPEQASPRRGPITVATDVHGLGACLYACLTSEPPFPGEDLLDVLYASVNQIPPSARSRNPLVSRDLAAVCGKCLEKDPGKRYRQVTELTDDLRRLLSGHPTLARPPSLTRRVVMWAHRRPAIASASAILCFSVILIGLTSIATINANANARAATRVAEVSQFFTSMERIQARRLDPRPEWTRDNLIDLQGLAHSTLAADHVVALRSEAAAALGGLDLVRQDDLAVGFEGYAVVVHPSQPVIVITEKQRVRELNSSRVRVVNYETGNVVRDYEVPDDTDWERKKQKSDYCECVAISPDGKWLVAGSRSGWIHVWEWDGTSQTPTSVKNHDTPIAHLAFTESGNLLFVSSDNACTCHHKAKNWAQVGTSTSGGCALPKTVPSRADISATETLPSAWDPKEHLRKICYPWAKTIPQMQGLSQVHAQGVVHFTHDTGIELLDSQTGEVRAFSQSNDDQIISTGLVRRPFFPSQGTVFAVTGEMSNRVRLWDLSHFQPALNYATLDNGSCVSDFSRTGDRLFVVGDGVVRSFRLPSFGVHDSMEWSPRVILDFDISMTGDIALNRLNPTPSQNEFQTMLTVRSRDDIVRAEIPKSSVFFATGNRWVVSRQHLAEFLEIHHYETNNSHVLIQGIKDVEDIHVSPDDDLWIASGFGAYKFNPHRHVIEAKWPNHGYANEQGMTIQRLAAGPTTVLLGRRDGSVIALNPDATERVTRKPFLSPVTALGQHPAGDFAVAGSFDGDLWFLSLPTTDAIRYVTKGHSDAVTSVAISADGLVATGSADRTVKLWSKTGEPILSLYFHTGVKRVRFSADGRDLLVLAAGERALRRWRLAPLAAGLNSLGIDSNLISFSK